MEFAIPIVLIVVLLAWSIGNYNGLVRVNNHCDEAWSDIETELKRRHDLIPRLVETVQGYARHEERVFRSVSEARTKAQQDHDSAASVVADENDLVRQVGGLFALAEAIPELKADEHFRALQTELANTEDRVQSVRRFYNANVRDLNNRIESFPSNLLARTFRFDQRTFFELENLAERINIRVEDLD